MKEGANLKLRPKEAHPATRSRTCTQAFATLTWSFPRFPRRAWVPLSCPSGGLASQTRRYPAVALNPCPCTTNGLFEIGFPCINNMHPLPGKQRGAFGMFVFLPTMFLCRFVGRKCRIKGGCTLLITLSAGTWGPHVLLSHTEAIG
jgi:hypothetical protein